MYDNTGTVECRLKEQIIYGASVYMWHEGSHSSDVYWFRAKLEWGKEGKIMIPLGDSYKHLFIMCVFNLTFQGGNQLLFEH